MAAKEDEIRRAQEEFTQSIRVKEKQGALSDIRSMISNHRDMMDVSRSGGRPSNGLPYSMQRPH